MMEQTTQAPRVVRVIPPTVSVTETVANEYRQKRVVAYCRVSTKQDEQLNSYENQVNYYTERIHREPDWTLVHIFADRGITGTSVKKRDEFNKMIRLCKQGKVDMIICKSISRFARNTVDCLKYTRMLKELGVDVYFEEQGIHSSQTGAEFYITIYGSIAQSESENISANIKWGKAQSAKEGKVSFNYSNFLGYRRGADGKPEIVPEEAAVIRLIYEQFLAGDSFGNIVRLLEERGIKSPSGKEKWSYSTVQSILTNAEFNAMLKNISSDSVDSFDENRAKCLMNEKNNLQQKLSQIADAKQKWENTQSRLDDIYTILDGLKNHPMEYDDRIVRHIIECVVVEPKEEIKVIFIGGLETTERLRTDCSP